MDRREHADLLRKEERENRLMDVAAPTPEESQRILERIRLTLKENTKSSEIAEEIYWLPI